MSGWSVIGSVLQAGIWKVRLAGGPDAPELEVLYLNRPLPGLAITPDEEGWQAAIALPPEILTDGAQVVLMVERGAGETLCHLGLLAGDASDEDLRCELDLLRAELDLLKRAFRRHCSDHG